MLTSVAFLIAVPKYLSRVMQEEEFVLAHDLRVQLTTVVKA